MEKKPHVSVLKDEVVEIFTGITIKSFIDGTLGAGGHTLAVLNAHPEIEKVIGIDQDEEALKIAKSNLKGYPVEFIHSNFAKADLKAADGILADLGVSSMQLDQAEKGFSFMRDGPLDMRMDKRGELTAEIIVNQWDAKDIARIIRDYGEEKRWKRATDAIMRNRPFYSTLELGQCLTNALYDPRKRIDPSTLVFQALRIAVNDELGMLEKFLPKAIEALNKGGRLAIITFHSLEDRIVKHFFKELASDKVSTSGLSGLFLSKEPVVKILTAKPIIALPEESFANPRARSAKLRGVEKL